MTLETTKLDLAHYLMSDEAIAEFLTETAREGDAADFIHVLGIAARARGMSEIAKKAGVTRAS